MHFLKELFLIKKSYVFPEEAVFKNEEWHSPLNELFLRRKSESFIDEATFIEEGMMHFFEGVVIKKEELCL